jgi:hypothetical protein
MAAKAVSDIIRTTLGPRSMLKMLLDAQVRASAPLRLITTTALFPTPPSDPSSTPTASTRAARLLTLAWTTQCSFAA